MRWWRAMTSPRGEMWSRAILCLCAVILAVAAFIEADNRVYAWLWVVLAVANGVMAVRGWRRLRARSDEEQQVGTAPAP